MSVQKITSLTQQRKSLKQNNTKNNTFLNGISFKGYTKQITKNNGSRPYDRDSYGTSGSIHYDGYYATVKKRDVEHPKNTHVINGNKGYNQQDYDSATVDVYYADPGEQITKKIKDNHRYIVKYDEIPDIISEDAINNSAKTSELKRYIEILEERKKYLSTEHKKATSELGKAEVALGIARATYQAAQEDYSKKMQDKTAKELELEENSDRLKLAKNRFEEVKRIEEEEYIAAQTRKALGEMQQKLDKLNDNNDSGLSAIIAKMQEYLDTKGE